MTQMKTIKELTKEEIDSLTDECQVYIDRIAFELDRRECLQSILDFGDFIRKKLEDLK